MSAAPLPRAPLIESAADAYQRLAQIRALAAAQQLGQELAWTGLPALEDADACFEYGERTYGIKPGVIDGETASVFLDGCCTFLAYELHMRTGFPLAVFSVGEGNWFGHAGLLVGQDGFLDVLGLTTLAQAAKRYPFASFKVLGLADFLALTFDEQHHRQPLAALGELEALHTRWVADRLLRNSGLLPAI